MPRHKPNNIWIDADSCPKAVKEVVCKTSQRLNINIVFVANDYQNILHSNLIQLIVVNKGFDAADNHIVAHFEIHDIVITADIPLAALVLKKRLLQLILEAKFILKTTLIFNAWGSGRIAGLQA